MRQHQTQLAQSSQVNKPKPLAVEALPQNNDYKVHWAAVKMDLERLKALSNHDDRDTLKADELVPKYHDYIDEWMQSGSTEQNDIVAYYIIWLCDAGQLDKAVILADIALERGLKFQMMARDPITFVADEVFRAADKNNNMPDVYRIVFDKMHDNFWEINDSLKARFYRHTGIFIMESEPEMALQYFEKAIELKADIGVKGRITKLQDLLK